MDTSDVDAQSRKLIEEFSQHYVDFCKARPDIPKPDKHLVFEGWIIQKVASLQLTVIELYKELGME